MQRLGRVYNFLGDAHESLSRARRVLEEENVIIDEEEIRDYFDRTLEDILEQTEIKRDELKSIVKEKIEKIKNGKKKTSNKRV